MATENVSRMTKYGAPSWLRGVCVAALAFFLIGNLILISFAWVHRDGAKSYAKLAFLGILALIALVILARGWRSAVAPWRKIE